MNFSDYTDSGAISLGATDALRGAQIVELSDGNYVIVDIEDVEGSKQARIRKYTKDTSTQSGTTKYVVDGGTPITISTSTHVEETLDVTVLPGKNQFVVVAPLSTGGAYFNIYNNDLTLADDFPNQNSSQTQDTVNDFYGGIVANSDGDFVYVASEDGNGTPCTAFYYDYGNDYYTWTDTYNDIASEWFHDVNFLSNGNILITSLNRGGNQTTYFSVVNPTNGNVIAGPTAVTGDVLASNTPVTAVHDGGFVIYWSDDWGATKYRRAARYSNAGVLDTNYALESRVTSSNYRDTSATTTTTNDGEVSMAAWRDNDGADHIDLFLYDVTGTGSMGEDTVSITDGSDDLWYPEVSSLGGDGGFLVSWINGTDGTLYYRSYRSNEAIAGGGGGGDPHIVPVFGAPYDLPHDEQTYLMFDNQDDSYRVQIKAKLRQKGSHSFFGYIKISTPDQEYIVDCRNPGLNLCRYTNESQLHQFQLPLIEDTFYRSLQVNRVYWKKDAQRMGNTLTLPIPEACLRIKVIGYSRNISQIEIETKYRIFHQARGALVRPEIIPVDF